MSAAPRGSMGILRAATAAVVLLAALALVAWRQGRAFELLSEVEDARRDEGVLRAERADLERRVQVLESRAHVVPEARRVLGMRMPEAAEIVILPGETP